MKLEKVIQYTIFLVLLYSCGSSPRKTTSLESFSYKKSDPKYLFDKQPNNLYFTVLQLNDVYEIAPVQGGKYGGMARVETIRKELLKEDPNTFTVLAGDFLNPSLLGTMKLDGERVKGRQMIEVMNAMNFDLVAFGNHEFDISYEDLQNRLNESNFEWISSNVLHNVNGRAHYFQKIKNGRKQSLNDSYIQEVYMNGQSIKVGFISSCIASNPKDYVVYGDVFIEAERSYNEIKNQTDIILGLTHLDIEQDIALAKKLPNIPLIMGGHEHTNNYLNINNVKIAKADANAKSVYIHRFEYNILTKETKVISELKEVNATIPEDEAIASLVNKWQNILNEKIKEVIADPNEVIYTTQTPLEGRDTPTRAQQTNLGKVISASMANAYNNEVDCAIVNGGSIRLDDVLIGAINPVDVFRVLPFGGSILKIEIKGSLLNEVLNYGEQAIGTGAYLHRHNIIKQGGNWFIQNEILDLDKTYKVAVTDYLMKGFDIPVLKDTHPEVLTVYKPQTDEVASDIRKAIVAYLKELN